MIKVVQLESVDLPDLETYLKKCIETKQEFYFLHLHESHLNYPKKMQTKISEFKKKSSKMSEYQKFIFTIDKYETNIIKNGYKNNTPEIRINGLGIGRGKYIYHLSKVTVKGKTFYTSFYRGDMDEDTLTIPVEIFDNWDPNEHPIERFDIVKQINDSEEKYVIYKMLDVFNLNQESEDSNFRNHESYEIIYKLLNKFSIYL